MPYRLIKTVDGRRGGFLFLASLSYISIGVANVITIPSPAVDLAFAWVPYRINGPTLGWLWIIVGLFMAVSGIISAGHSKLEAFGYVSSLIPPFIWAFIFCGSYLFGNPYGLRGGVVYLFLSIAMFYIAGWPNNTTLRKESTDAPTA